jgi:hypothetical protein
MSSKYQGRLDPLEILRNSISTDKRAKIKEKYLIFDKEIKLALSTPTAWLSPQTKKQYSLGSLWLYLESVHKNIGLSEYLPKVS